jgi:hypothetical protein
MQEWSMADPERVTDDLVAIRQAIYSSAGFEQAMKNILVLQDITLANAIPFDRGLGKHQGADASRLDHS